MEQLIVVRHGIAVEHGTPGIPDDLRPLTPRGEKRLKQIANGLKRLRLEPERIASSPLPRAWRTAEIITEILDLSKRLERAEVLAARHGAEEIRDWLGARPEPSLMIVGHNPALSRLIGLLVTGGIDGDVCDLDKGGVAVLSSASVRGRFRLEWLAPARLLRRLA